jgi:hypothetical protein
LPFRNDVARGARKHDPRPAELRLKGSAGAWGDFEKTLIPTMPENESKTALIH